MLCIDKFCFGAKTGLTIDDFDLIEANEAFAAQSIAVARDLGFDMSKGNLMSCMQILEKIHMASREESDQE